MDKKYLDHSPRLGKRLSDYLRSGRTDLALFFPYITRACYFLQSDVPLGTDIPVLNLIVLGAVELTRIRLQGGRVWLIFLLQMTHFLILYHVVKFAFG